MARHVFVLTGLLVVLMAAGRAGIHAGSSLDGPVIPVPLEAAAEKADGAAKAGASASGGTAVAEAGELVSTIEMPGTAFRLVYLFTQDSGGGKGGDAVGKGKPISVVIWKALEVGAKVSPRAVRERIAENSAAPSMTAKAVYALQPDFRLQKVALSPSEINRLFDLLQAGNGQAIAADALWKGKIAGQIKEVEWLEDGSRKTKSKQAKATSSKSSKGSKAGKSSKTASVRKPAAKSTKAQAKPKSSVSRSSGKAAKA